LIWILDGWVMEMSALGGGVGFVVPHPCDGKTSQGWGTVGSAGNCR